MFCKKLILKFCQNLEKTAIPEPISNKAPGLHFFIFDPFFVIDKVKLCDDDVDLKRAMSN